MPSSPEHSHVSSARGCRYFVVRPGIIATVEFAPLTLSLILWVMCAGMLLMWSILFNWQNKKNKQKNTGPFSKTVNHPFIIMDSSILFTFKSRLHRPTARKFRFLEYTQTQTKTKQPRRVMRQIYFIFPTHRHVVNCF